MTSAAVSNITAPVNPAGSSAKDTNKVAEGADVTFQNLLQNPKQQGKSLMAQVNTSTPQKTESVNGVNPAEKPYEAVSRREAVKIDDASHGQKKVLSEEEVAKAEGAVSEFAEEVKQILEEELNVSEEEIETAMQTLGLAFLDLSNPDNLVQLIGMLTGTEESTDLLMNQNLNGIMAQVSELVTNLTEETGIPMEQLTALGMTETVDTSNEEFQTILTETAESIEVPEEAFAAAETTETSESEAVEAKDLTPEVSARSAAGTAQTKAEETPRDLPEDAAPESEEIRTAPVELKATETAEEENGSAGGQSESGNEFSAQTGNGAEETKKTALQEKPVQEAHTTVQQTANHIDQTLLNPEQQEVRSTVDVRDLMEQFQQFARANITPDTTSIEMRLNPENLGRVLIHVTEQEGSVRATIQTQNAEVKEAMEGQLAVLRTTLEGQGIKVTEVEVTVASHEFEENLEKGNTETDLNEEQQQRERTGEEQGEGRRRNLNVNNLDELHGLMTEEEQLAAQIMKDNGNSVDYTA